MLWLICIVSGMIVVPIICEITDGYWDFLSVLMGALIGLILSLLILLGLSFALYDAPTTVQEYSTTDLIALHDGMSIDVHGTYFLGTGHASSDEDLEYRFIYRDEKGMRVGERRASNVYLEYIQGDETPRLVKYKTRYDNTFWDWLLGAADSWEVFYVPEGSITNSIQIDLQ